GCLAGASPAPVRRLRLFSLDLTVSWASAWVRASELVTCLPVQPCRRGGLCTRQEGRPRRPTLLTSCIRPGQQVESCDPAQEHFQVRTMGGKRSDPPPAGTPAEVAAAPGADTTDALPDVGPAAKVAVSANWLDGRGD